ncbi:MAG: hypothetical protein R3F54_15025 [Alphaproteobacteria bacterium]
MDDPKPVNGVPPLGIESIDRIGVVRISETLGISPQAVRKWRQKGKIPEDRQGALHRMLAALPEQVSALPQVAEVSKAVQVVPTASRRATRSGLGTGESDQSTHPALSVAPADPPRLEDIAGQHARASMTLLIAARDVDQARAVVDKAAAAADGRPPIPPVRGYKTRLAVLFALDFPILTMAFVAVTQVSPIIAAGSAIALSLGLILCAHAAGARLRALANLIPAWARDLTTLIIMLLLIAAVIGVATDLRLKGFELDGQILKSAQTGIFNDQTAILSGLPEPFIWAIVRAAGLVTILLTVFGVVWSYQHHGPEGAFARAEMAYRKALRRYASAVQRSKLTSVAAPAMAIGALITLATAQPTYADTCDGPSVLAFVDTTTAYDDRDREQIMPAIDDMVKSLAPGSRLIIRTVRDAPASSRLLLDICTPAATTFAWTVRDVWQWLISNPMDARTAVADFHAAIRDALLPELRQRSDAPSTALVDTLAHFADEAEQLSAIWLFTDLLDSVAVPTDVLLSRSDSLTQISDRPPKITGVDVYVAGAGRFHDQKRRPLTPKEYGALIDSWAGFVRQSGGELHIVE